MPKLQTALGFQNLPNTTICNIAMNYMTTPKPRSVPVTVWEWSRTPRTLESGARKSSKEKSPLSHFYNDKRFGLDFITGSWSQVAVVEVASVGGRYTTSLFIVKACQYLKTSTTWSYIRQGRLLSPSIVTEYWTYFALSSLISSGSSCQVITSFNVHARVIRFS